MRDSRQLRRDRPPRAGRGKNPDLRERRRRAVVPGTGRAGAPARCARARCLGRLARPRHHPLRRRRHNPQGPSEVTHQAVVDGARAVRAGARPRFRQAPAQGADPDLRGYGGRRRRPFPPALQRRRCAQSRRHRLRPHDGRDLDRSRHSRRRPPGRAGGRRDQPHHDQPQPAVGQSPDLANRGAQHHRCAPRHGGAAVAS